MTERQTKEAMELFRAVLLNSVITTAALYQYKLLGIGKYIIFVFQEYNVTISLHYVHQAFGMAEGALTAAGDKGLRLVFSDGGGEANCLRGGQGWF